LVVAFSQLVAVNQLRGGQSPRQGIGFSMT
jgi:hypothetical protein